MKMQQNWILWVLVFLVAVTLFGPTMIAYAGPPSHNPTQAFLEVVLGAFGDCGRVLNPQH
jgi:hypothetical protein